jgi:hypothetical protein
MAWKSMSKQPAAMTPSTSAPPASKASPAARREGRRKTRSVFLLVLALGAAMSVAWVAIQETMARTGRTPAELLDYLDRRAQGHPKVQFVVGPIMDEVRTALDAPSLQALERQPFQIPPPPPRRGPQEISAAPAVAGARVWRVGPNGPLIRISEAVQQAQDGDVVEIEAGDYHGEVAVWTQKRLTIRGVNGAARLYAEGKSAEGKAIWVIRNGTFDISNIDFIGAKVGDGNGAGIRFEIGHLKLRGCLFWGNQMGLVTAGRPHAVNTTLDIEFSEFAYSRVEGRWGHNLYVGAIDRLSVVGSYFHHAARGHLLKSRAERNEILYNRFTDEIGGRASYELNFPNGGITRLVGNIVQQQHGTENGVMVSFGEEGYQWPTNTLHMGNNTLVNDHPHGGAFLRVSPGADQVVSVNNLLVGFGRYLVSENMTRHNDVQAEWADLNQPARQDYRLRSPNVRFSYQRSDRSDLVPRSQYRHPRSVHPLPLDPEFVGADQRLPNG